MESKDSLITVVNSDNSLRLYEFEFTNFKTGCNICFHVIAPYFDLAYNYALLFYPSEKFDLYSFDTRFFHQLSLDPSFVSSVDGDVFYNQGLTEEVYVNQSKDE